MRIGLFIPCYINQFYPQVGIATLELLEKLGLDVDYPLQQTCCGQPLANSGFESDAVKTCQLFVKNFHPYDYIVAPSGSCVYHVRHHFDILEQSADVSHVRDKTCELCEFLVKILKVKNVDASFPYKVGLHQSCHGLRGLRLGQASEIMDSDYSVVKQLLESVKDLQLVDLERADECCGFGGTFAVTEEAVSVKMGSDRIKDHLQNGAQVITATDMSCLMHLEGMICRQKLPVQIRHVAEILNSRV
jgi:L-lactate dehydrogenase complex protein LldE